MASLSLNAPLLRFSPHRSISLPSRFFSPLLFPNPLHFSPPRHISAHTAIGTSLLDTVANLPEFEGSDEDKEQEEKEVVLPTFPVPKLTVKEKKELASYAHSLGKKLKYQQVGKSGVTPAVAASFVQTLEANELLKRGNEAKKVAAGSESVSGVVGSAWNEVDRERIKWDWEGSGHHCLKSTRRRLLLGEGAMEEEVEGKEGDWVRMTVESKSRSCLDTAAIADLELDASCNGGGGGGGGSRGRVVVATVVGFDLTRSRRGVVEALIAAYRELDGRQEGE